jgi:hypothetical protein
MGRHLSKKRRLLLDETASIPIPGPLPPSTTLIWGNWLFAMVGSIFDSFTIFQTTSTYFSASSISESVPLQVQFKATSSHTGASSSSSDASFASGSNSGAGSSPSDPSSCLEDHLEGDAQAFWRTLGCLLHNYLGSMKGSKLTQGRLPNSLFLFQEDWWKEIAAWVLDNRGLQTVKTNAGIFHLEIDNPADLCSLWKEETVLLWHNLPRNEFVWVQKLHFVWTPPKIINSDTATPRRPLPIGHLYVKFSLFKGDSRSGLQTS